MVPVNSATTEKYTSTYNKRVDQSSNSSVQKKRSNATAKTDTSQVQLSDKAKALLEKLKKKYGNMDFFAADFSNDNEAKEILSRGTKEFSVLFSSDELEKMASDDKYLQEKESILEGAVRMSEQINEQFGAGKALGKDAVTSSDITKIGMSFNADGSVSYFAELERSSEKQRERIEHNREKKADEKKEATTKKVTVEASSEEELIKLLKQIDWSKIKEEKQEVSGSKFDYSV